MTSNIDKVKQIYAYFGQGNLDGVIGMLDENVKWVIAEIKNYPPSGTHNGKDEVRNFFISVASLVDTLEFNSTNFLADGDFVVVQGNYKFKVKSNGNIISSDWVEVFKFENGLIKYYEEYTDTAAFQNAFS